MSAVKPVAWQIHLADGCRKQSAQFYCGVGKHGRSRQSLMPIKDPVKRRENHRRYMRERYNSDPLHRSKQLARVASRKHGKIEKQSCSKCAAPEAEKHHEDYTRPHDIVWLCRSCHLDLHYE